MKFVVGTSRGIAVVDDRPHKIFEGHVYGVTWDHNYLYACERISEGTSVHRFDKNFKRVDGRKAAGVHSVHQALYNPNDELVYITDTRHNRLVLWDPIKGQNKSDHNWTGHPNDTHHINSVHYDKQGRIYVYEHKVNGRHGGIRRLTADWKSDEVWLAGTKGHNVAVFDDALITVDSFGENQKSRVLSVDIISKQVTTLITTDEYDGYGARGLAVSGNYMLVGMTKLASRMKRNDPQHKGYVVLYEFMSDTKWTKVKDWAIPHCGQVYEVRLLDMPDSAHNGIVWEC